MDDPRRGLAYGAGAYLAWGLFPLFWPLLEPAGAVEILAHRVVWTLAVVLLLLAVTRRWAWVRNTEGAPRRFGLLALAAVFIAVNWTTYIWGVNHGHVLETSLGYFTNPIVTVALGVLVLGERLRPGQWLAIGVGSLAVVVLSVDYGRPPWVALALAVSFALYGLLKKSAGVGAVESLGVETAVLVLPALGYLGWLTASGGGTTSPTPVGHALLLLATGPLTAGPLLLFGAAARRLPLSVVGMLQYLAPVLQFLLGLLVFHEPMPAPRLAGFALVWSALLILTVEGIGRQRRRVPTATAAPGPAPGPAPGSRSGTVSNPVSGRVSGGASGVQPAVSGGA